MFAGRRPLLKVLHGHAAWAPGQLEGEIRAQAWTWAADIGPAFALSELDALDEAGELRPLLWELATAATAMAARQRQA